MKIAHASVLLFCSVVAASNAYAQDHALDNSQAIEGQVADRVRGEPNKSEHSAEYPDPSRFNFFNVHYSGKDEYGGVYGDGHQVTPEGTTEEEEPMSPPFVFFLLNFALMVFILGKYLWPAAKKLAANRHDQIKDALDEAAKLRNQAAKKLAEYESRIKDVDREIKQLVDGIRADAEADRARILETANAQAAQMKRDAEQRIAAEIELARSQLTKEVTAAAAHAAEKLLKDRATADDQNQLVASFISGISGTSNPSGVN